jgi:hypothetical protein
MPDLHMTGIYLYALKFNDGVVKVGQTIRIAERIETHRQNARKLGFTICDGWTSYPCMWLSDERRLIEFCKERWPLVQGLEYFAGDFDAIVSFAEALESAARARRTARSWQLGTLDAEIHILREQERAARTV